MNGDGISAPASLDLAKARAMTPDWTTFNGYANQYVTHPLTSKPGETVRFYVVAAGPTLDTNFHVVGTIFDRAWVNGDRGRCPTSRRGRPRAGSPLEGGVPAPGVAGPLRMCGTPLPGSWAGVPENERRSGRLGDEAEHRDELE
jgi:hypothetical protein